MTLSDPTGRNAEFLALMQDWSGSGTVSQETSAPCDDECCTADERLLSVPDLFVCNLVASGVLVRLR